MELLYIIASAETAHTLMIEVNEAMKKGYQPIGGVSVAVWTTHDSEWANSETTQCEYSQALVRKGEEA